jgi:SPP1 family predicted phage head-tail adaptor
MRDRIELRRRAITPPVYNSTDITEEYETVCIEWAKVDTPTLASSSGRDEFTDVNIGERASHIFTIRFNTEVTAQLIVTYRGENYRILKVIDPEERRMYQQLHCVLKGDEDKEANK